MARLLTSVWMVVLLGTILFFGTMFFLLDPSKLGTLAKSEETIVEARVTGASWEFVDPEVNRLVEELNQEKQLVAKQREELTQWAKRLQAEQAELSSVTQAVQQAQIEFDKNWLRFQAEEVKNVKRLAKTFSGMQPETAVKVMEQLGEDEMVKLLAVMKDDQVTTLLELIASKGEEQAKRAAALAKRLREVILEEDAKP